MRDRRRGRPNIVVPSQSDKSTKRKLLVRNAISSRTRANHTLLRVVTSRRPHSSVEFSGHTLLSAGQDAVARLNLAKSARPVLLLLPHSAELFLLHIGLALNGHAPAILPWPTTRVDAEKYRNNLLHQLANLPIDYLVTTPAVAASLEGAVRQRILTCDVGTSGRFEHDLAAMRVRSTDMKVAPLVTPNVPDDVMFLQFSGGTTGMQKCVAVTEAMLTEQLTRLSGALRTTRDDGVVSWLPLYHDMGLIANVWLPLFAQIPSTHVAATDWIVDPEVLFQLLDEHRGTICWLPNFAFSYLARQRSRMRRAYDLRHVRAWISCSEPVRKASMTAFADAFDDWGVRPQALQASYAMAENVFAVTQTDVACTPRYHGPHASSGRVLPGMDLRIGDRGNIEIRTPSLFNGYWSAAGTIRDAFTEDGWYSTGDCGFIDGGELFVIGRLKDLIIVGGQNVFPEDVESIVAAAAHVHPGRAVAFGIDDEELGTQAIAIVAEMDGEYTEAGAAAVEADIRSLVTAAIGIAPRRVDVVPRQWIVKSTAGKISRHDTKQRFLQERLHA
jgi:fatty-acyl-CoA synthase